MPTILLRAEPGDRPPDVLLVEDPEDAERAASFLDGGQGRSNLISDHRGLPSFSGRWSGHPVTIQTTGLGAPAVAMIVEELLMIGARRFVRVAPAMAVAPRLRLGGTIVVLAASATDGTSRTLLGRQQVAPVGDFALADALVQAAQAAGVDVDVGSVATVDVLPDAVQRAELAAHGVLAADLGTAPLFVLAARGDARRPPDGARIRAAALLWIDQLATVEGSRPDDPGPEGLLRIALDVLSGPQASGCLTAKVDAGR